MEQAIIATIIILVAVFFIVHKIYKKINTIKRGEDICKSNDCDGCSLKQECNKGKRDSNI